MTTLAEFIQARILQYADLMTGRRQANPVAPAHSVSFYDGRAHVQYDHSSFPLPEMTVQEYCDTFTIPAPDDPAVLNLIASHQALLKVHGGSHRCITKGVPVHWQDTMPCPVLRAVGIAWRHHDDYETGWDPR